jgi:anti-anti-sigma factor
MSVAPQVSIDSENDDVVVARVNGEIDLANAEAVGNEVAQAVPNRALGLVIDLSGTSYLDSSGVSLVFEIAERLRRRQQLQRLVVPANAPLGRVLRILDSGSTLPVVESVEEASAQIRAGA